MHLILSPLQNSCRGGQQSSNNGPKSFSLSSSPSRTHHISNVVLTPTRQPSHYPSINQPTSPSTSLLSSSTTPQTQKDVPSCS